MMTQNKPQRCNLDGFLLVVRNKSNERESLQTDLLVHESYSRRGAINFAIFIKHRSALLPGMSIDLPPPLTAE